MFAIKNGAKIVLYFIVETESGQILTIYDCNLTKLTFSMLKIP